MIDREAADKALATALAGGVEFADIFAESTKALDLTATVDGRQPPQRRSHEGAGIRVITGSATGYAARGSLAPHDLAVAARTALAGARSAATSVRGIAIADRPTDGSSDAAVHRWTAGEGSARARRNSGGEVLAAAEQAVRERLGENRLVGLVLRYEEIDRRTLVASTERVWVEQDLPRTSLRVETVLDGGMGVGWLGTSSVDGVQIGDVAAAAAASAERATRLVAARPGPSGTLPVVLAPGAAGILLHEACGHALEVDLVRRRASVYRPLLGTRVASEALTLVDDGAVQESWGYTPFDDEGMPAERTVLVDHGVLAGWLWDLAHAREAGHPFTGNGRRESYRHLPLPRMTHTYAEAGPDDPADLVSVVGRGVDVGELVGGQLNPVTGDFVFGTGEAFLIEQGELGPPVRPLNLVGNAVAVMRSIDGVGNDLQHWRGAAMCGKGQLVPAGVGAPTLLVNGMTCGGPGG